MTHNDDRLENELAALRPVEPCERLAERIGARLAVEAKAPAATKRYGTRRVPATYWLVGAVAAGLLVAVAIWRSGDRTQDAVPPLEPAQSPLAAALDDSLPSVWAYRRALASPDALEPLLDQHASRPSAAGDPVQTRGFGPLTMDLNSRLGGL
jgi:hypothetical protein